MNVCTNKETLIYPAIEPKKGLLERVLNLLKVSKKSKNENNERHLRIVK